MSSLFIERERAWQVTPEGEALYQRAQFILSYVAGLEKDIRESRNKVSGLVRIGGVPAVPLAGKYTRFRP